MSEKVARLKKTDGDVSIEIIIGQAQWGKYFIYLWDEEGLNSTLVGSGLNVDNVPDKFVVSTPVSKLNGCLLSWEVSVMAFSDSPGQLYAVTAEITQKGNVVPAGLIVDSGELDGAIFVNNFVRFLVV